MKAIFAHLTGNSSDRSVLESSLRMAQPFNAHIEATLVTPDPKDLIRQAVQIDATNALLIAEAIAALEQESKDRSRDAHVIFEDFCAKEALTRSERPNSANAVTVSWKELTGGVVDCLAARGRYQDLLVMAGGPERKGRLSVGEIGQIVLSCGRPVLLAPEQEPTAPFNTIMIAWKDTPEAAHAVTAALPILKRAKRVEVVSTNEQDVGALGCLEGCESIIHYLRWHDIDAHMHYCLPAGRSVSDAILEKAKGRDCDLLVMGAYGHSRLREFIFGGVTRRVLSGADMPIFLVH